ncbi:hypothetical protein ACFO25_12840 [Paenactinomyces guangxiensis]|uniref:Lipoprotein n=1 Tax=Paenactinomyces guangxiensis TaxID=1490290 RepID=A0A7W1WRN5_9BACL|nr:hypothetical protein [Paenactinomyces guangxiensis]MBA4494621.1 hypothetical protein [Paenactinomyces guangxiensis]MBH8591616.1 hypothetical protein [Paenactinomyces guangxiensis]
MKKSIFSIIFISVSLICTFAITGCRKAPKVNPNFGDYEKNKQTDKKPDNNQKYDHLEERQSNLYPSLNHRSTANAIFAIQTFTLRTTPIPSKAQKTTKYCFFAIFCAKSKIFMKRRHLEKRHEETGQQIYVQ